MATVRLRRVLAVSLFCLLLAIMGEALRLIWLLHRPIHIEDGFENTELSPIWTTRRMVPGAFSIQSEIVHSGKRAARITLRQNDRFEPGSDDGAASERDELMETLRYWSRSNEIYDYTFSLYLPTDFPVVDNRLVIAQWKQFCEWMDCRPDNPVLAVRYVGGVLFVTRKNDAGEATIYKSSGEMRGRWLNFRFITRFSQNDDGILQGWLNGQQIVDYRGITAYRSAKGYPAHGLFFFKMGLYRNLMAQPMTMYLDDFRKDQCSTLDCNEATLRK